MQRDNGVAAVNCMTAVFKNRICCCEEAESQAVIVIAGANGISKDEISRRIYQDDLRVGGAVVAVVRNGPHSPNGIR